MNAARTLIFALILISFSFAQSPQDLFNSAEASIAAKQFSAAQEQLDQAIKADPTFAPALFLLAQVYIRSGDMEKAGEFFRTAIETEPENEEYRAEYEKVTELLSMMSEAIRYMNSGDLDDAYATFENVLVDFPHFAKAAYNMGGVNMRRKDYDGAIADFQRTLTINPEFANAHSAIQNVVKNKFNDGNRLYKMGDLEGAMESYYKVLEYDSTFFQAHYQIGVISGRLGDVDKAIILYKKALEFQPNSARVLFGLGLAYKKIGDIDAALETFQNAVNVDPTHAKSYSSMGEIYVDRQEYEKAIDRFQLAISVDPTYAKAYENLGLTYTKLEQWEDAVQYLTQAVAFNAKSLNGWYYLSQSYNQLGDCENALDAAKTAVDVRNNYAPALIEMGVAYYCNGKGDKTRALNSLEKARNDSQWRRVAEYEIDRIKNPAKYEE